MTILHSLAKLVFGLTAFAALCACSLPADQNAPSVAMGNFSLGHNIVVVDEPAIGPFSRTVTDEEWKTSLTSAIAQRFGGYEGDRLYHLGIKIEGYALAVPGVPIVFSPKSILIVTVTAWDDAEQRKLNEEPKQITVFEGLSGKTVLGSGLFKNKKKQMTTLSINTAKAIQDWLFENPEWFGMTAEEVTQARLEAKGRDADETSAEVVDVVTVETLPADQFVAPKPRPSN